MLSEKKYKKAKKKWIEKNFMYFCVVDSSGNYVERGTKNSIKIDANMDASKKALFLSLFNVDIEQAVFYAIRASRIPNTSLQFSFVSPKGGKIYTVKKRIDKVKKENKKEKERIAEMEKMKEIDNLGRY